MPIIVAYVHAYVPDHNAGAETTMHDLLKYLVTQGWEAHVVIKPRTTIVSQISSNEKKPEYYIDGVHVIPSYDKRPFIHYMDRADVTISHLECSQRTHLYSKQRKIPTVHLVHNTHPLTVRWMYDADALIINTEWISKEPDFKKANKPTMILNPPVNPAEYKTTKGKSITLVNLWEDKGAKVFYELADRFPELPFLGVRGGYGVQVEEDRANVTIMEHTKDMKKVYGETKVILMPSKYESFGRVGVEALASGIPTLAEPTPGLLESLGDAGTFADRNDTDAWETALRDLLKPAKYGKMSKLAKARSEVLDKERSIQLMTVGLFLGELLRIRKAR